MATERAAVAASLSLVRRHGYRLLDNRGWPGPRQTPIDAIVVGPGGAFILDFQDWTDVHVTNGALLVGDDDRTDDIAGIADVAYGSEESFIEVGLAPGEVHPVIVVPAPQAPGSLVGPVYIVGESQLADWLVARGGRLSERQVARAFDAAVAHFPELRTGLPPEQPAQPDELDDSPGDELTDANPDAAPVPEAVLSAPIEEWMTYLHPDQARLVRRSFNGPSRFRGAAGTGKTVVGLHRAAYLARAQAGLVLVTSYVSSLPAVQAALLRRMAPEISDRVEFVGIHAFAKRLLFERGIQSNVQLGIAADEFDIAWRTVGLPGLLGTLESKPSYWDDEIQFVIKGRGIDTFDQYAQLARTGRRRRLSQDQRRLVWDLYQTYQSRMAARGAQDNADLILMAEESLRQTPMRDYTAVIVDEAQDLSATMMIMLHHLVGNRRDGITLIGDGQQTIYPGGYTLSEVDISVDGRSVLLSTNYRNTAEILEFASKLVDADEINDIDGSLAVSESAQRTLRSGDVPEIERFTSRNDHDMGLLRHIRELVARPGVSLADIGILSITPSGARSAVDVLRRANIPLVELTSYDGRPTDAVKVGTVKRAKGLEFKQVLVAQISAALLDGTGFPEGTHDDASYEQRQLQKRELYVAATRARDGLWIGVLS